MTKHEKLIREEQTLGNFDLMLSIIQSDCGTKKHLKAFKQKVKECRKALRCIPLPPHLREKKK
jgi:hypothetical protein